MRHFCPQVFRHQLLDAAVWQTPRQYSSQDFAAKAGTVTNDVTATSATAPQAISTRMISPHGIVCLSRYASRHYGKLAYAPIGCLRRKAIIQTGPAAWPAESSRHRTWPAAARARTAPPAPSQPHPRPNVRHGLGRCWLRAIYEELEIFPLGQRERNSKTGPLPLNPGPEDQVDGAAPLIAVYPNNCRELISSSRVQFDRHDPVSSTGLFHFRHTDINTRQSSRLAEFGGRGMSFNFYRGSRK